MSAIWFTMTCLCCIIFGYGIGSHDYRAAFYIFPGTLISAYYLAKEMK